MSRIPAESIRAEKQEIASSQVTMRSAKSRLTKLAAWINDWNIPFLISSIGMVIMLLWAGSYKMTVPGAEGIVPLVSNSPLISWHFKLFGPYLGSDLIGLTEWAAAILISIGYRYGKHNSYLGKSHLRKVILSPLDTRAAGDQDRRHRTWSF
jgi:uncharacterized membrane protein YkgB